MLETADTLRLNFDPATLRVLNVVLGIVMFGIALDMRAADFLRIMTAGRSVAIGLTGQFMVLPAFTFLMVLALDPPPGVALGLILVAACPGGNMSNFLTHHAKGDTALSVTMTAASTAASFVMTPLNVALWGGLHPASRRILREVSLDPVQMVTTVVLILGLPLAAGMALASRRPALTDRLRKPMKIFSLLVFGSMVAFAIAGNYKAFLPVLGGIAMLVAIHNAGGLALGYGASRAFGLREADRRAVALEVGMQNSGLGLILIFNCFDGNGAMAVVAAWWGVWHIISGLTLSTWWRRREPQP